MNKSIPPLSLKKQSKSVSKAKILLNGQEYYPNSNDKSITTDDSYTLLTEKNIKQKNTKIFNIFSKNNSEKNIINKNNNNNHFKSTNSIITNSNDSKALQSIAFIQPVKPGILKNKTNLNSIIGQRLITIVTNNSNKTRNIKSPKSINSINSINAKSSCRTKLPALPMISKKQLLTEADSVVKERKRHEGLFAPHIPKNVAMKKSAEINLKNYVIRKIKEKQEEIRNDEKKIIEDFKYKQKIYDKNYKNFLNTIEENQKREKEEENELNILKAEMHDIENAYNKEIVINKKLVDKLKKLINSIITYKKYASFIHKIFGRIFIFDKVGDFDGKDYYKMMYNLIDIYEQKRIVPNFEKEENEFLELLFSNGVDLLLLQFSSMEERVRNELDQRNDTKEQINDLNYKIKNEINALNIKKTEGEKDKIFYNKNKKQEMQMIKYYGGYDINETKTYLNYIVEIGEMLGSTNKKKINEIDDSEIIEESLFFCEDTLKKLEGKEYCINKYMNEIENIFYNGNDNDKIIIEKIIYDRKKYNLKLKQFEIRKMQEEEDNKKKFKSIDNSQKIILKGRKVIQDFPLIKSNKKKKKLTIKKNNDDFEYLYYSSDEN
jgi:hypothetical protein